MAFNKKLIIIYNFNQKKIIQIFIMISSDITQIQKTKKVKSSGIRSKLRKIVWAIAILASILTVSISQNIQGYFAGSILVIIASIFHILAKYIDSSLLTVDLAITLSIGYFLAFFTFILIPADTALSIRYENVFKDSPQSKEIADLSQINNTNYLYDNTFYKTWYVVYWVMMVINMFIMNVQNLFHKTGHVFFCSRIIGTIVSYIKLCLVFVIPFVIGCIILFIFTKSFGIGVMTQVFLLLSNIYGITVLVLLIGYGLVQFPYSLWSKTNTNGTLDVLLTKAEPLFNRYCDVQTNLLLATQKMHNIINKIYDGHQLFPYKDMFINELPNLDEHRSYKSSSASSNLSKHLTDMPDIINENYVANARFALKSAKYNFVKVFNKWKQHCDKIYKIIDIQSLEEKKDLVSPSKDNQNQKSSSNKNKDSLKSKFLNTSFNDLLKDYKQLEAKKMDKKYVVFYKISACLAGMLSILIIYSETALIFSTDDNQAIVFMRIIQNSTNVAGVIFFILIILGYVIYCACFALFEIDLGAGFEIYPYHTHPLTLMFNSKTCGTIAFPLCYNIMLMLDQVNNNGLKVHSGFDTFFRPMQSVPFLGRWYNLIVCFLISVVGIISMFGSLKKLLKTITRDKIDMGSNEVEVEKIQSGEKWVINEWQRRKRQQFINNIQNKNSNQDLSQKELEQNQSGLFNKIKSFFTYNKKDNKNHNVQELTETQTNQQKKPASKLAQLINNNNQSQNRINHSNILEEGGIVARVRQQQYLQQQLKEMSLEEMVNGKQTINYTNEISLDDSFFQTKQDVTDQDKSKIPTFQVIHIEDMDQGQDFENRQHQNTMLATNIASDFYANKKQQKDSIARTDTSNYDLTYSESSSSSIRVKKNAVSIFNQNETNPNSAGSDDSYAHDFEVNIYGKNVKHKMFNQPNRKITENLDENELNEQKEPRLKVNNPQLFKTQLNEISSQLGESQLGQSDFQNTLQQFDIEKPNIASYQMSLNAFSPQYQAPIISELNKDEIEDGYQNHYQQKYNNNQFYDNIEYIQNSIDQNTFQQKEQNGFDEIKQQNINNDDFQTNGNQIVQNSQSNLSNVSQKSLKINLDSIKGSVDDNQQNYKNMNMIGEIEFQKERKKNQKIKKIHKKILQQGKDISDNFEVNSDVYDNNDNSESDKEQNELQNENEEENNESPLNQISQNIKYQSEAKSKPIEKSKSLKNDADYSSDNTDDLEYQITRGRSKIVQAQQSKSQIHTDGGWVYKKSENKVMRKLNGWKKKYLIVKEGSLFYYESNEQQQKRNEIPMKDIINVIQYNKDARKVNKKETNQDRNIRFIVYTKDRKFDFKTESEQDTIEWVDHIQNNVLRYQKSCEKQKK
ncbi:hypothetical protein ABPG72_000844 [Tetrahymena utriculariae]